MVGTSVAYSSLIYFHTACIFYFYVSFSFPQSIQNDDKFFRIYSNVNEWNKKKSIHARRLARSPKENDVIMRFFFCFLTILFHFNRKQEELSHKCVCVTSFSLQTVHRKINKKSFNTKCFFMSKKAKIVEKLGYSLIRFIINSVWVNCPLLSPYISLKISVHS